MNYLLFGFIVIVDCQFHQPYCGLGQRVQLRDIQKPSSADSNNEAILSMISDIIAKETASQFATNFAATPKTTTNLRARNQQFKNPHRFVKLQRRMFARYHGIARH